MPFVMQIAVASTLLALGAAVPTVQKRSAFTIRETVNPGYVKNGPASHAKTLAKFGVAPEKVSAILKASAALTTSGRVVATPFTHDNEFLCPVTIGNQNFILNFDTASSDLWVFGHESSRFHTIYNPGSTSRKLEGETWSIRYGDETSASGIVYTDTVEVGGISVTEQAVEVTRFMNSDFVCDGVFGLGFSALNTVVPTRQKSWFDNAVAQGMPAIFAADLVSKATGFYDFGALSSLYSVSDITYTDVDNWDDHWQFTPDSITIGSGEPFPIGPAIVDTGSTLILLHKDVAEVYYRNIRGIKWSKSLNAFVYNCRAILPDLTVTINGYKIVVPGSVLNHMPVDARNKICYGGIQTNDEIEESIFGGMFIKTQYVVFDQTTGSPRLGFAPKVART